MVSFHFVSVNNVGCVLNDAGIRVRISLIAQN